MPNQLLHRHFIDGSDARMIMGKDEAALPAPENGAVVPRRLFWERRSGRLGPYFAGPQQISYASPA
jgi:hypothetical protein